MANMTFLATFDGDLTFQSAGGGGTLTHSGGTLTYGPGHWSGKQGVLLNEAAEKLEDTAASRATYISVDAGALVARFRRDVDRGTHQYVVSFGDANTAPNVFAYMRFNTSDQFDAMFKASPIVLDTMAEIGVSHTGYLGWNASTVGAAVDGGLITNIARPLPGAPLGTGANEGLHIGSSGVNSFYLNGGLIDAVAAFDGPLTQSEWAYLDGYATPWTFGMALEPQAPVVNAGSNAGVAQHQVWTQAGSFTDADSAGPWTATVDYDDGGGAVPLTLDGQSFTLSHTYTSVGTYTVTVTVDDGGQIGSDTVQVTVVEGLLTGGFTVSPVTGTHPTAPRITLP